MSGCLDTLHEGGVGPDSASALCSKLAALAASPLESLEEEPSHFASFDKPEDWMNLSVALCCMLMAATASGLTMGVVSLDELELRGEAQLEGLIAAALLVGAIQDELERVLRRA